jgi:hypothetical protein
MESAMPVHSHTAVPRPHLLPVIVVLGLIVGGALVGCSKSSPSAGPTPAGTAATAVTTTPPPSVSALPNAAELCALLESIGTQSGLMTNKHYIPLQNETLDQFKVLVNLTLAARDQLTALTPAQLQPQLAISLQYFQALKDNDFASTVAPPAGFVEANATINQYQVSTCGFVFDK